MSNDFLKFLSLSKTVDRLRLAEAIDFAQKNVDRWNATKKTKANCHGFFVARIYYAFLPAIKTIGPIEKRLSLQKGLREALEANKIPRRLWGKYHPLLG